MGASSGLMMASSSASQGMTSFGSAYSQSQAMRSQGAYLQRVAETNSDLSRIKADDATQRGEAAVNRNDMRTRQIVGSQRAALAAQGIDVNSGSAMDAQRSTAAMGALDDLTIRNNAWREAWGYKVQGLNDSYSGQFSGMGSNFAADNTLLTGGMKAVSSFEQGGYYYSQTRPMQAPQGGGNGGGSGSGGSSGYGLGVDYSGFR